MPVRSELLINNTFDSAAESSNGAHDFNGEVPLRLSLYVEVSTIVGSTSEDAALTVELSPDDGATLISYDKILDHNGNDAPQSSISYTLDAVADDVLSISPEDVIDYIKVTVAADGDAGTPLSASHSAVVKVWLVWSY